MYPFHHLFIHSFSHLHLSSHPLLHILQLSASCFVFSFSVFHCPSNEAHPGLNILVFLFNYMLCKCSLRINKNSLFCGHNNLYKLTGAVSEDVLVQGGSKGMTFLWFKKCSCKEFPCKRNFLVKLCPYFRGGSGPRPPPPPPSHSYATV